MDPLNSHVESEEENAIKAKLRGYCEKKPDGTSKCPGWLHEQWKNGDHLAMALQFQAHGFDRVSRTHLAKTLSNELVFHHSSTSKQRILATLWPPRKSSNASGRKRRPRQIPP